MLLPTPRTAQSGLAGNTPRQRAKATTSWLRQAFTGKGYILGNGERNLHGKNDRF